MKRARETISGFWIRYGIVSEKDLRDMNAQFDKLDKSGDGAVSLTEIIDLLDESRAALEASVAAEVLAPGSGGPS